MWLIIVHVVIKMDFETKITGRNNDPYSILLDCYGNSSGHGVKISERQDKGIDDRGNSVTKIEILGGTRTEHDDGTETPTEIACLNCQRIGTENIGPQPRKFSGLCR